MWIFSSKILFFDLMQKMLLKTPKEIKIKLLNHKIIICDNAGGIDQRVINSLFKKHVSTKKSSGGSGMGLYMSQQIAYKFGAKISVENIQKGACFSITTL